MKLRCILLALLLLLTSGCGGMEQSQNGIRIYYASQSDTAGRSALDYELWTEHPNKLTPELLLEQMMQQPQSPDLFSVLPSGLRLQSTELANGTLTLDFSEIFNGLSDISLTAARGCLALTMSQLPDVSRLVITVEGHTLPAGGSNPISASDLLLTGELSDPTVLGFQLYFPSVNGSELRREYHETEIYDTSLISQAETVISLLTVGPNNLENCRPAFSDLEWQLNCTLVEHTCLITLTEHWNTQLIRDPDALQALVNSLCELPDIQSVAFEGIDDSPLLRQECYYPTFSIS